MKAVSTGFLFLFLGLTILSSSVFAQEQTDREKLFKELARDMVGKKTIELEALEIRARIHEPNVIYVLDRARLEVNFAEEELRFSPRILKPVLEDDL